MNILLTNDDGIHAPGLCALYEALKDEHEVYVVAPDSERSAVGHAITLADPLRVRRLNRDGRHFGWAINGTPADCVKLGIHELVKQPVDLVLSGINLGANVGINLLYSGTVSAATEAAILGIRSAAFSLDTLKEPDYCFAAHFAGRFVPWLIEARAGTGVAMNINVPAIHPRDIKGIRFASQGLTPYREEFDRRTDPRGNIYYWQASQRLTAREREEVDSVLLKKGYITITPIHYDLTAHDVLRTLAPPESLW